MNTRTLFTIAFKNLRRHFRRTVINVVSIGISAGVLVFFLGYYRGTYIVMMREAYIRYKTAHLQMQSKDFNEKKPQDYVTPRTVIAEYARVIGAIAATESVTAVSGRLVGSGYVGNGQEKMVVTIVGADPERDRDITVVDEHVREGTYLDKGDGVLIGKKTAQLFNLKVGDLCFLQAQTVDNAPNIIQLPVAGIYNTGFYELDKNTVFVSLASANELFDTGDAINKIMVFLRDMDLSAEIAARFGRVFGGSLDVKPWEHYSQAILENERSDRLFYAIFLVILVFISVSTIMGTMYVSVYERTREIGTLRAIGWTRNEVFRLFMLEALAIGATGSLAGLIIGGIPTAYLALVGVDYSKMSDVIAIPIFKLISDPKVYDFVIAFALGVAATYLGGLLPARKASKMVITDALRVT